MNRDGGRPTGAGGCKPALSTATAAAAVARAEEENERKREAKAKDERAREAAKKAEKEMLEVKKRAAAAASEALEIKQRIKSAEAKEAARLAAEKREAAALWENGVNTTSDPSHNIKEEKEIISATSSINILEESSVVNTNLGKQTETEMQDEKAREREVRASCYKAREEAKKAEEEKYAAKKRAAARTAEALEITDEIKSTKVREAARLAAEKRAARAPHKPQHNSVNVASAPPQPRITEKEIGNATGEQWFVKEISRGNTSHGVNETLGHLKQEIVTPAPDSIKTSGQEKETVNVTNAKHTLMESNEEKVGHHEYIRSAMHNSIKEEKSIHPAGQESRQKMTRDYMEDHVQQSGVRPKKRTIEHTERAHHDNNTLRDTITIERKQRARYSSEKEIVSVTGTEKNPINESSLMRNDLMNQYVELGNQPKMDDTCMEEGKQEYSRRFQSGNHPGGSLARGDMESHQHQDTHGPPTPQHSTPPAKGSSSFKCSHHHCYSTHHFHQNDYSNGKKQQPHHKDHHSAQQQEQQRTPAHLVSRKLICGSCHEKYNFKEKMPRELYCSHSLCTSCIRERINSDFSVVCPFCPIQTWNIKNAHWCPVNEYLIQMLGDEIQKDVYREEIEDESKPYSSAGSDRRQSQTQHRNDSTERSGIKPLMIKSERGKYKAPAKSPHDSKCLEIGVHPTHYCSACLVWVCGKCAEAEHMMKKCSLKPLKDQLSEMKQNYDLTAKRTQELFKKSLQNLENYCDEENIFQLWMRATFECIEKKQENIKKSLQVGRELMNTLTDVTQAMPNTQNLPEALITFQILEDITGEAHRWSSDAEPSATGTDQERTACLRSLMMRTLKSLPVRNGISEMVVADKIPNTQMFSELRVDGGRFHLHALRKTTKQETRALPLQCFKSCQDTASMLVFLDLFWGGKCHGRLYIRLTGDTLRGRQFISLCTGEGGVSFRGTCFHRVWWKGLPGEHIWTGDYENSDGSGSRTPPSSSRELQIPAGREVPISAGLVAGRFEKENLSSIFRIYTRGEKDMRDEAAFGQVEFGLDVVREAVKLKNISEVVISDCGFVLET